MVDLHSHILPGLDDGAANIEQSLDIARVAEAAGVDTLAATPHIRDDHAFSLDLIEDRLGALRTALQEAEIAVQIVRGGEVSLSKVAEFKDEALETLCIGDGRYLLVESPYTEAPSLLEKVLFDLQVRGFKPILAHPERSMSFLHDRARLERLVENGVVCSVTAMSLTGAFGTSIRAYTLRLFAAGLVHNIASDAHDATRRAPGFQSALAVLESELDGAPAAAGWFTEETGRAIVQGRDLPGEPPVLLPRPTGWKRMKERVGLA
jgi:protein-tyrosine phosphatase